MPTVPVQQRSHQQQGTSGESGHTSTPAPLHVALSPSGTVTLHSRMVLDSLSAVADSSVVLGTSDCPADGDRAGSSGYSADAERSTHSISSCCSDDDFIEIPPWKADQAREDRDLAKAIQNSLLDGNNNSTDSASPYLPELEPLDLVEGENHPNSSKDAIEILREHVRSLINPRDREQKLLVCRNNTFTTFVNAVQGKKVKDTLPISVKFFDSLGTVDDGGPKREFLRKLITDIVEKSGTMERTDNGYTLTHNALLLARSHYYYAGFGFAMAMVFGGPPVNLLNPVLYDFLTGVDDPEVGIDDLGDRVAAKIIAMFHEADSQERLDYVSSGFGQTKEEGELFMLKRPEDLLLEAGVPTFLNMSNKAERLRLLKRHVAIGRIRNEIEQFRAGIEHYQLLPIVSENREAFRDLIVFGKSFPAITGTEVIEMFRPVFSENGSVKRRVEDRMMANWAMYMTSMPEERDPSTDEAPDRLLTPADILEWASGAREVPQLGWNGEPALQFDHRLHPESSLPESRTCGPTIILPILNNGTEDFEVFKERMDMAVKGSLPGIYLN